MNGLEDESHFLENFLLFLAKNADPNRFFPFPDAFRSDVPDAQISDIEIRDIAQMNLSNKSEVKSTSQTVTVKSINQITIIQDFNKSATVKDSTDQSKVKDSTNKSASQNSAVKDNVQSITNTVFAPYTENDYKTMKSVLNTIISIPMNDADPTQEMLIDYIKSTPIEMQFHGKSIHTDIVEYEFRYSSVMERILNNRHKHRWYLFHGSSLGNWHSIVRNGIKNMSQTKFMTTGAVYGNGIYLSDNIMTAYGYSGNNKIRCVAVVEVFEDPKKYKKAEGIYVIPNENVLIPRYLFKVIRPPNFKGDDVLEFYKKSKERVINKPINEHFAKRLANDLADAEKQIKEISPGSGPINSQGDMYIYLLENVIVEVYLDAFPLLSPYIKLKYEIIPSLPEYFDSNGIYKSITDWAPADHLSTVLIKLLKLFKASKTQMTENEIVLTEDMMKCYRYDSPNA